MVPRMSEWCSLRSRWVFLLHWDISREKEVLDWVLQMFIFYTVLGLCFKFIHDIPFGFIHFQTAFNCFTVFLLPAEHSNLLSWPFLQAFPGSQGVLHVSENHSFSTFHLLFGFEWLNGLNISIWLYPIVDVCAKGVPPYETQMRPRFFWCMSERFFPSSKWQEAMSNMIKATLDLRW